MFGKVNDLIVLPNNLIVLYIKLYRVLHFDDDYYAYAVIPTSNTFVQDLLYPLVLYHYSRFDRHTTTYIMPLSMHY